MSKNVNKMVHFHKEIKSISKEWFSLMVGEDGITEFVPYYESGQMAEVPWIAIYKGDEIISRIDATGLYIQYFED
jgi:hypothetical protein